MKRIISLLLFLLITWQTGAQPVTGIPLRKYLEFARLGFPLKSVNYYGGYETISEVTQLDKQKLEPVVFIVPADYKQVSLIEIGLNKEVAE